MRCDVRAKSSGSAGFVLPLVMVTALVLLLSGLALQAMALQSLAQQRVQWQLAQQRDAQISTAMKDAIDLNGALD